MIAPLQLALMAARRKRKRRTGKKKVPSIIIQNNPMVKVLTGKVKVSILKCFMRGIWILAKNKNDFKYNFDQKV